MSLFPVVGGDLTKRLDDAERSLHDIRSLLEQHLAIMQRIMEALEK